MTLENLSNRSQYLNARNTFVELMAFGAIPVVNENVGGGGGGKGMEGSTGRRGAEGGQGQGRGLGERRGSGSGGG